MRWGRWYLHFDEVGSQPVDDLEVGGKVPVGVKVVLVGLLLVTLVVEQGAHLLQNDRVRGYQAQQLQVPEKHAKPSTYSMTLNTSNGSLP